MQGAGQQRLTLAATSVSYIVVILDTSIVNVALERIAAGPGTGVVGLQWVVNAYTLSFASLLLTGGALGDRWGPRPVYMAGLLLFTLASALCGMAPSLAALIGARLAQGVGAALLVPCSLALLNAANPEPAARSAAIGVWAACGAAALAAGPLVGGALIASFGWRSIFLVNLPIGAIGVWLTSALAEPHADAAGRPGGGTAQQLDPAGQATAILALGALTAGLIEAAPLGWRSPAVIRLLATGLAAGLAFFAVEARSRAPMLPLPLLGRPTLAAAAGVALVSALTLFGLVFVLSLYFQSIDRLSPLATGLAFLPLTAVVGVGNIVAGRLGARLGARHLLVTGLLLCTAGFLGLAALIGQDAAYPILVAPLLTIGLGGGLVAPTAAASVMAAAPEPQAGIAAGVLNAARQIGVATGVALFGGLIADPTRFVFGIRLTLWLSAALSVFAALAASRHVEPMKAARGKG